MDKLPFGKPDTPVLDRRLVDAFRRGHLRCIVRGCSRPTEVHHIQRRRRGGDQDHNLVALCGFHHTGPEGIHFVGERTWVQRYADRLDKDVVTQLRRALRMEETT